MPTLMEQVDEIARSIKQSQTTFDCDQWAEDFCFKLREVDIPFIQNRIRFCPNRSTKEILTNCRMMWGPSYDKMHIGYDTHWFTIVSFDGMPMIFDNSFGKISIGYCGGNLVEFFYWLDVKYEREGRSKHLSVANDMIIDFAINRQMDRSALIKVRNDEHPYKSYMRG